VPNRSCTTCHAEGELTNDAAGETGSSKSGKHGATSRLILGIPRDHRR